jgi:hypothetical protein
LLVRIGLLFAFAYLYFVPSIRRLFTATARQDIGGSDPYKNI